MKLRAVNGAVLSALVLVGCGGGGGGDATPAAVTPTPTTTPSTPTETPSCVGSPTITAVTVTGGGSLDSTLPLQAAAKDLATLLAGAQLYLAYLNGRTTYQFGGVTADGGLEGASSDKACALYGPDDKLVSATGQTKVTLRCAVTYAKPKASQWDLHAFTLTPVAGSGAVSFSVEGEAGQSLGCGSTLSSYNPLDGGTVLKNRGTLSVSSDKSNTLTSYSFSGELPKTFKPDTDDFYNQVGYSDLELTGTVSIDKTGQVASFTTEGGVGVLGTPVGGWTAVLSPGSTVTYTAADGSLAYSLLIVQPN